MTIREHCVISESELDHESKSWLVENIRTAKSTLWVRSVPVGLANVSIMRNGYCGWIRSLFGEIDFDSAQESRMIFLVIVEVNIMTDQRHSCVVFQDWKLELNTYCTLKT